MNLLKSTFEEYLAIEPLLSEDSKREVLTIPRPRKVGKCEVPENLNDLTIGALLMMQRGGKDARSLCGVVARDVVGTTFEALMEAKAYDVIGLLNFVAEEMQRISKLFSEAGRKPTSQEIRAGYNELDFGAFGIIDWFTQRSNGRLSHEEASAVKWPLILEAMRKDAKLERYGRRYEEVLRADAKLKR